MEEKRMEEKAFRPSSAGAPAGQMRNFSFCAETENETLDLLSETMVRVTSVSFSGESAREAVDQLKGRCA
jgi:hypothetical protein